MNQLSTQDLLEMAAADVLGLLDTDERDAFERAFRGAPPALQAQVRREQLRLSGSDEFLPNVELPLGLRARVLAAIREAVHTAMPRADVAATIGPDFVRSHRVSRWWRAGAIGAAAACVVLSFSALQLRRDYDKFASATESNVTRDLFLKTYGARFEQTFLNPNTRFVQFAPVMTSAPTGPNGMSRATLLLDPETKKAQIFLKNLSQLGGEFSLVITDESGEVINVQALLEFHNSGTGVELHNIDKLDLEGIRGMAIIEKAAEGVKTLLKTRL